MEAREYFQKIVLDQLEEVRVLDELIDLKLLVNSLTNELNVVRAELENSRLEVTTIKNSRSWKLISFLKRAPKTRPPQDPLPAVSPPILAPPTEAPLSHHQLSLNALRVLSAILSTMQGKR